MNTTFKFFEDLAELTTAYNQLTQGFFTRLLESENRRLFRYLVELDLI